MAAVAPARASVTVNGSDRTELIDCNGADAVVNGAGNRLVFHGACRSLLINGASNVVEIDLLPGGAVTVAGSDNQVLYTPIVPGPVVSSQGEGNVIDAGNVGAGPASAALAPEVPEQPPAPAVIPPAQTGAAGSLVLSGDGQTQSVNCANRNVVIAASGSHYRLDGGCRSVTVDGNADTVRAELVPGARVTVGGNGVRFAFTLFGTGPEPTLTVTGNASLVTRIDPDGPAP